jgi:hypothetical protein
MTSLRTEEAASFLISDTVCVMPGVQSKALSGSGFLSITYSLKYIFHVPMPK